MLDPLPAPTTADVDAKRAYLAALPHARLVEFALALDARLHDAARPSPWPADLGVAAAPRPPTPPAPPQPPVAQEDEEPAPVSNQDVLRHITTILQHTAEQQQQQQQQQQQAQQAQQAQALPPAGAVQVHNATTFPAQPYGGPPRPSAPGQYAYASFGAPAAHPYAAPPGTTAAPPRAPAPRRDEATLPSYEDMIVLALGELRDPEGCAPKTLFSWMAARYPLQANFRPSASQALQKAYKRGRLEKSAGGKYRINPSFDPGIMHGVRRPTRRPLSMAAAQAALAGRKARAVGKPPPPPRAPTQAPTPPMPGTPQPPPPSQPPGSPAGPPAPAPPPPGFGHPPQHVPYGAAWPAPPVTRTVAPLAVLDAGAAQAGVQKQVQDDALARILRVLQTHGNGSSSATTTPRATAAGVEGRGGLSDADRGALQKGLFQLAKELAEIVAEEEEEEEEESEEEEGGAAGWMAGSAAGWTTGGGVAPGSAAGWTTGVGGAHASVNGSTAVNGDTSADGNGAAIGNANGDTGASTREETPGMQTRASSPDFEFPDTISAPAPAPAGQPMQDLLSSLQALQPQAPAQPQPQPQSQPQPQPTPQPQPQPQHQTEPPQEPPQASTSSSTFDLTPPVTAMPASDDFFSAMLSAISSSAATPAPQPADMPFPDAAASFADGLSAAQADAAIAALFDLEPPPAGAGPAPDGLASMFPLGDGVLSLDALFPPAEAAAAEPPPQPPMQNGDEDDEDDEDMEMVVIP